MAAFATLDCRVSVQVKITNRPSRIRRFFGFSNGFLKLLLQQISSMLLRLNRLAEDRIATAVLFLHRPGGFFHIIKGFWLDRGGVRYHGFILRVNLQHRAAARAGYFEAGLLAHLRNHTAKTVTGVPAESAAP